MRRDTVSSTAAIDNATVAATAPSPDAETAISAIQQDYLDVATDEPTVPLDDDYEVLRDFFPDPRGSGQPERRARLTWKGFYPGPGGIVLLIARLVRLK
mmetsp:Transcript_15205/g.61120  ORF Transcript_15205/g.61120 Transcript_15205/m.61120 type:complete len:99 (+) Transcript_15205:751-1047(+)